MKQNMKIGIAFGGGASRGFAHIGVLQVLEEMGLKPDYIAGSSIGSIIGALYAAGLTPSMMAGISSNIDTKLCYDIGLRRSGFIQGKKVEELMKLLTRDRDFKDMEIPLAITAVDLIKCERVIITEGKVYKAVRASISIPGVFQPVVDGDRVLVDGGILERVPVNVAREMGADIVIGVDVAFRGEHRAPTNFLETIIQSQEVMQLEIMKHTVPSDDIMICPEINLSNPLAFDKIDEVIEAGRAAALKAADKLRVIRPAEVTGQRDSELSGPSVTMDTV